MNLNKSVVLDSSVWIELLTSGTRLKACQSAFDQAKLIIVPTTVIFEVYRKIASLLSEDEALSAMTILMKQEVKDLTKEIALTAADLSIEHKLAMADSYVLAHARLTHSTLITLDNDFSHLEDVKIIRQ